jgi:hypothetical protein
LPEHPFLGEKERNVYQAQAIRLLVHQLLAPYSFPKGTKEMAAQVLAAQSYISKSMNRGAIPKRLRLKKYFQEAAFLYGLVAEARKERVPGLLRRVLPSGPLPGWPKEPEEPRRRRRRRRQKITIEKPESIS